MREQIGYVGAGWCRQCEGVRIRTPKGRRRVCAECGEEMPDPLLIDDPGWPPGVFAGWADRRPRMDPASVRTRLTLESGDYLERRSLATQDDTLAAVEGLRADHGAVMRYSAVDEASVPTRASTMHQMGLEQAHEQVVARIREQENGPDGRVLRSAVAMHIETLASRYAESAAASAAWAVSQARIVALAGRGAVDIAVHDTERGLWAARTPGGGIVALAPVVDGKWTGELFTPEPSAARADG